MAASITDFYHLPKEYKVREWDSTQGKGVYINKSKVLFSKQIFEAALSNIIKPSWMMLDTTKRFIYISKFYEPVPDGQVLATFRVNGKLYPAIVKDKQQIIFNFDIEQTINDILSEKYLERKRGIVSRLPFHHHILPASVRFRILKSINSAWHLTRGNIQFPSWPIDTSVDMLRFILFRSFQLIYPEPAAKKKFWPTGVKSMVCLTHDVDTVAALRNIEKISSVEHEFGFKATWFIVGNKLQKSPQIIDSLIKKGDEIGLHGHNHDFKLPFLRESEIRERIENYENEMNEYEVVGFRSPGMLRSEALLNVLEHFFKYDSSFVGTERYSFTVPGEGCCTVFPFTIGSLLEIPVTIPMDVSLKVAGMSPREMLNLWLRKIRLVKNIGGVCVLSTHADSHLLAHADMLKAYRKLLGIIARDNSLKVVTLKKLAVYWKRSRV